VGTLGGGRRGLKPRQEHNPLTTMRDTEALFDFPADWG